MSIKRLLSLRMLLLGMLLVILPLSIIVIQKQQQIEKQEAAEQVTFTFVNNTNQTIWVGALGRTLPNNGGWELAANSSSTVSVPNDWSGRFWGRTGCKFDAQGNGTCETGDCAGRLQCNGLSGKTPASLAEFTLNSYGGMDFYNVSLVDGWNLPLFINAVDSTKPDPITANGCIDRPASKGPSGCTSEVNAICPTEMQVKNPAGQVVACTTACSAFNTDQYCCRGVYGGRDNCKPAEWPVDYAYNVFKKSQPFAYSYAYDDATSVFTCTKCNYRITFGVSSSTTAPTTAVPVPTTAAPIIVSPTLYCLGSCLISPSPSGTAVPTVNLSNTPNGNLSNMPTLGLSNMPIVSIAPPSHSDNTNNSILVFLLQLLQLLLQFLRSLF